MFKEGNSRDIEDISDEKATEILNRKGKEKQNKLRLVKHPDAKNRNTYTRK